MTEEEILWSIAEHSDMIKKACLIDEIRLADNTATMDGSNWIEIEIDGVKIKILIEEIADRSQTSNE